MESNSANGKVGEFSAYGAGGDKTVKYSPGYPGRFEGIDHAREWMSGFIANYKNRPHEGLAFYTPVDVFNDRIDAVHARRQTARWMPLLRGTPRTLPQGSTNRPTTATARHYQPR